MSGQGGRPLKPFTGSFTQQEALDDTVIAAATEILRSGRLHRYNSGPEELSKASELEQAYAAYQGARYCLACASGGYAMAIALRAAGLGSGEAVLTNGFTLAPVPGAIAAAGGKPLLVEITEGLVIDLQDLDRKAGASGARFLLLSNMRGHLADMEQLAAIVRKRDLILIEDCAHTMGAAWNGRKSGGFGLAGCFSTQTYKHLNSGEGGLLTSDDPEFMARAIILSGSYMLYERHGAAPACRGVRADPAGNPQHVRPHGQSARGRSCCRSSPGSKHSIERWNDRYRAVEQALVGRTRCIAVPRRPAGGALRRQLHPVPPARHIPGFWPPHSSRRTGRWASS
jgi:hypothetical protein